MDYKTFNNLFPDGFTQFRWKNRDKKIDDEVIKDINALYDGEGMQGDSSEIHEIYDMGLKDGLFVKLVINTDSYGDNEYVDNVQFVQGKEKTITVYEYVK